MHNSFSRDWVDKTVFELVVNDWRGLHARIDLAAASLSGSRINGTFIRATARIIQQASGS
jgi:hypothetical protein